MAFIREKRRVTELTETVEELQQEVLVLEAGVLWLPAVETAPTVGRADQVGFFVEGGVLKAILPNDSVEVVAYEA